MAKGLKPAPTLTNTKPRGVARRGKGGSAEGRLRQSLIVIDLTLFPDKITPQIS